MKKTYLILIMLFSMHLVLGQSSANRQTAYLNCYFSYNSATWPKDSLAKLETWLKPYLAKSAVTIELSAYTDTIGSVSNNQQLAGRRLKSVQNYFTKKNIAINETSVLGESYSKSGYQNDKLYRKVQIKVEFEEPLVVASDPAGDGLQQRLNERMETFETSTDAIVLDIQFVPGQDVYIGDSYLEVVALLQYLKQNPRKKAFIRGHVCCANDMELSMRRAFAVYNDLLMEGISAERISYQGFGNTIPRVEELDELTRQQNRRVDVVFSGE